MQLKACNTTNFSVKEGQTTINAPQQVYGLPTQALQQYPSQKPATRQIASTGVTGPPLGKVGILMSGTCRHLPFPRVVQIGLEWGQEQV